MDRYVTYALAGVIAVDFAIHVLKRRFDPFAPVWLFLVGYVQVYVIQALSYRDWALTARGDDVLTAASARALWACLLFLGVYHSGLGSALARCLPKPPERWSVGAVSVFSPLLIAWGLFCSGMVIRLGASTEMSAEQALVLAFPSVMLLGAIMLIVTGRCGGARRPVFHYAGLAAAAMYILIWMFNGRRSHALMGVLATVCAVYVARGKRPSWPVLISTACSGVLVVALALGWRFHQNEYDRSAAGFLHYLSDFDASFMLECFNIDTRGEAGLRVSRETEEWGGFLLMLDTVPEKSDYDYGEPYLRMFSTFIPRFLWRDKPLFGREQWVSAWIAGSELKRDATFTGPAISVLGAAQLNGGAAATAVVLSALALLLRTAYEFFRRHSDSTWVQCWWAVTYFNAWFMVVNDDPMIWFYYNWGFTTLPPLLLLWLCNVGRAPHAVLAPAAA